MKRRFLLTAYPDGALILAPFVLFLPLIVRGEALFWGTPALQFIPWWTLAANSLASGELPLWNPLSGMGAPLLANYQSALLYPPTWVSLLLGVVGGPGWMAWGISFLAAGHLAWAGLGMARLGRRFDLPPLAQLIAGLAFSLSGYLAARAGFLSITVTAAWLPWLMLMVLRVSAGQASPQLDGGSGPDRRNRLMDLLGDGEHPLRLLTGLAAVLALQLLAGHAQTAWYSLLLAIAWAGYWGWSAAGWRGLLRAWLRLGIAGLLGGLIAAAQLLPTAEYLLQSQRAAQVDFEYAMTYSFWPWRFLGLVSPDLFGRPDLSSYWGYANFWEDAVYIGLLPFLLALATGWRSIFRRKYALADPARRLGRLCLAVLLAAFLLALGKNTPLFPWLYRHVPTFDMFQAPTRWSLLAVFSLALLAGLGAAAWRPPQGRALYWTRLATAGAAAITVGAGIGWLALSGSVEAGRLSTMARALGLSGLWAAGAGLLALGMPAEDQLGRRRLWTAAVSGWVALDLLAAGWGLNPGVGLDFYRRPPDLDAPVATALTGSRLYLPAVDEAEIKFERFLRFDSFVIGEDWRNLRTVLLPNLTLLDGIAAANNFDPLIPGRYAAWMTAVDAAPPADQARLLNLMGVGVVEKKDAMQAPGVRFELQQTAGLARWLPCAEASPDGDAALRRVLQNPGALETTVILEGIESDKIPECASQAGARVNILESGVNSLKVEVASDAEGWLLISQTWYPGWQAWVAGRPAQLFRADYVFQAVAVPQGRSEVTLAYRPPAFWGGLGLSLVGLAAGLAGWTYRRQGARPG